MNDLAPIIEQIGALSDKTEAGRWQIAEAIFDAFDELPHHTQGLLQGLCIRLKYSPTNVYNYKKAWQIRAGYFGQSNLSVSHYAKIYDLISQYELVDHDVLMYIEMADAESWSVQKLAQEVAGNHEPDPDGKYKKKRERFKKLMRSLWNDPQFHEEVPKILRDIYYQVLKGLEKI